MNHKKYNFHEVILYEIHREYCNRHPIVDHKDMFASSDNDWNGIEKEKTYYTDERFLPHILVDIGIYPSISEIRRNKPQLIKSLDSLDFIDRLKVKKKRKLWILVGE